MTFPRWSARFVRSRLRKDERFQNKDARWLRASVPKAAALRPCVFARTIREIASFPKSLATPKALPSPAVVVLHEVFGVNADIRKTCDELAEQGFIGVAPDLFWRQEPGTDLSVTSEPDWQHGLRLSGL